MTDKKSLKEHWSQKPEYCGKYIVQLMPPRKANGKSDWDAAGYDDKPIISADSWDEANQKAQALGYRTMTNEKGAQNVMIQCWQGAGPAVGQTDYDGPVLG